MNAPTVTATVDRATGEITTTTSPAEQQGLSEFQRLLEQRSAFNARTMMDGDNMDKMIRLAEIMADGKTTVPKHLQGNLGDCMAVVTQAMNWNMNAFAVAQKTHIVNGALGYEAQLVIAVLNASPLLATRVNYEWFGEWANVDGKTDKSVVRGVIVSATLRGEAAPRTLIVSMAQVGAVRNSPNWAADPRQQIAYLCAKRWARLHAPDVILGIYTPDELEEITSPAATPRDLPRNATPAQVGAAATPKAERTAAHAKIVADLEVLAFNRGSDALAEAWKALTKPDRTAIGPAELERLKGIAKECDDLAEVARQQAEADAAGAQQQTAEPGDGQ